MRTVGLFNIEEKTLKLTFAPRDLGLDPEKKYLLCNLWSGKITPFNGEISADLEPHGSRMYSVSPADGALQLLDSDVRIAASYETGFETAFPGEYELCFNREIQEIRNPDGSAAEFRRIPGDGCRIRLSGKAGNYTGKAK